MQMMMGGGRKKRVATVLSRSTAYWKASTYDAGNDRLTDLKGGVHHAQLGSVVGADTNDPLRLVYAGTKYLYLPGSTGNNVTTPDFAAFPVGDFEVEIDLALDDWTPTGSNGCIWSKDDGTNRTGYTEVQADGTIIHSWWDSGGTQRFVTFANPALVDASRHTLKFTLDVDNGAGSHAVRMFVDGVQSGDSPKAAGAFVTTVQDSSAVVLVGGRGASGATRPMTGKVYSFVVRDGIGGSVVASADFTTTPVEPYATFVGGAGLTWTFNRSASGRKLAVVDRTMLLFGTDDFLEVADHADLDFAAGDSFTVCALIRAYGTIGSSMAVVSKKVGAAASDVGWGIYVEMSVPDARAFIADGAAQNVDLQAGVTAGTLFLHSAVRNVTADTLGTYVNATSAAATGDTTTGTLANAEAVRIGRRSGAGTAYLDGEFVGAAIFREALTAADLTRLRTELLS